MAAPRAYTSDTLVVHPRSEAERAASGDPALLLEVTPALAGWEFISFQARRLPPGGIWRFETGENELALVDQTGRFAVDSSRGNWPEVGGRASVFAGAGHVLCLPRRTSFAVHALEDCHFLATWAPTDQDHPPFLREPEQSPVSLRGGDNATRQIVDLLPPGSPVHRLVLVEVYTPGGNWSSYPPHKHDVHTVAADGTLIEADLEEVYYYRFERPEGYAFQRIYTDDSSPLQQAGRPIDAVVRAGDGDAVLIPEGYHPVVTAPGYTAYYFNVLAGSAQSLANVDDPRYAWVKGSYTSVDPRLPIY